MTNIQRVGMINSNNTQRNSDHDFTKLRKRILGNQGGVESKEQFIFDNDTKKLSAGSDIATAYILCTRPASNPIPNQKFLAQFEFTGSLDFLNITNGDKIFIEIKEKLVKDPTLIEDLDSQTNYNQGLGIGEIKMAKNYPSHSNFLKLYEWNEGKLVDLRKAISLPALDEVAQRTDSLEEKLSTAEGQITQLVEAGTPSYLGITAIVGEKYTMEDTLFLQKTPQLADSTIAINVGDIDVNKEQHIQRISNGQPDNKLKLKMDKFGLPTTNVVVEVRKGIKVDVNEKEAYRYGGDELLASATLPYTTFTTEAQEITVNFDQPFQLSKGELYSVVVKQENGIVNAQNFYRLYCDTTQYSEAFSVVAVNGVNRVRNKLMPYCMSEGFVEEYLAKDVPNKPELSVPTAKISKLVLPKGNILSSKLFIFESQYNGSLKIHLKHKKYGGYNNNSYQISIGTEFKQYNASQYSGGTASQNFTVSRGNVIRIYINPYGSTPIEDFEIIFEYTIDKVIPWASKSFYPLSEFEIGSSIKILERGQIKNRWVSENKIGEIVLLYKTISSYSSEIDVSWEAPSAGILFFSYKIESSEGYINMGVWDIKKRGEGENSIPVKKGPLMIRSKSAELKLLYFIPL